MRSSGVAVADRYRWRMAESGLVMVQMTPDAAEVAPSLGPVLAPSMERVIARWEMLCNDTGDRFGVSRGWLLAMVWRESGGNPRAFNPDGGRGLLQITSAALKAGRTDEQLFDPGTNVGIGARYVADLMRRYGRDFPRVAAAFNAGSVRESERNPWGMVQTTGHVSAEVAALNYYLMRDEKLAAERAAAYRFSFLDLVPNHSAIEPEEPEPAA